MSPVMLGGIATAVGGALLVGIGVAAGRWTARRDHAAEIAWWEDTYADLGATYQADLAAANAQIAEALRIIDRFAQQHLDDAATGTWPLPDQVLLPPRTWAALREAQEHWESN